MSPPPAPPVAQDRVDAAAREDLRAAFEVEALHGRGPASLVYFARDLETGAGVAVKVFPRVSGLGASVVEDFRDAVAQAATLQHPHVASPYRAGASERFFWCALPRITGWSLADWLASDRRLELQPCLRLVTEVAGALEYAHGLGVVHGDLKPANVLLNVAPGAVVTDFWVPWVLECLGGLAAGENGEGRVRRMEYVAPEERSGEWPSPAGDQYALAAVTCHCLWGKAVLPDDPPARYRMISEALERALSAVPGARFPSVRDFAAALRAAAAAAPASPRQAPIEPLAIVLPEPAPPPTASHRAPKRRWIAGMLALAVAGAAGAVAVLGPGGEPGAPDSARAAAVPRESSVAEPFIATPIVAPPPSAPAPAPPLPSRPAVAAPQRSVPRAPVAAARPGRLFISSTPWGQAYVDSVLIGNTPQVGVPVAPGVHVVRVVRDGFEPYERSVRVGPGEDLRLVDIVLRELAP